MNPQTIEWLMSRVHHHLSETLAYDYNGHRVLGYQNGEVVDGEIQLSALHMFAEV
jgi:hypothetical protein